MNTPSRDRILENHFNDDDEAFHERVQFLGSLITNVTDVDQDDIDNGFADRFSDRDMSLRTLESLNDTLCQHNASALLGYLIVYLQDAQDNDSDYTSLSIAQHAQRFADRVKDHPGANL